MNLGMRPSNFEFLYGAPTLLKRDLLYFDQIHLCSANEVTALDNLQDIDPEYHNELQPEFELLKESGLLFTFNLSEMLDFTLKETGFPKSQLNKEDFLDLKKIMADFLQLPKPTKFGKYPGKKKAQQVIGQYMDDVDRIANETTRISAQFLTRFSARDDAFPLLQTDQVTEADPFHPAKVLEVVLEKLPIPDENVSWSQIVEYRADPDTEGKFNALRVWMQDVARKDYSKTEIEEQIAHHLHEYESHLRFHQLKYKYGTMQVLITTTLELLENVAKLNLGKVASTFFSFHEKSYGLLEAEMAAPGKEVAYISKTIKQF